MNLLYIGFAALSVAAIYYAWRAHFLVHRRRVLRERVAYMLWVTAQAFDPPRPVQSQAGPRNAEKNDCTGFDDGPIMV